jgi:hypothetical protein
MRRTTTLPLILTALSVLLGGCVQESVRSVNSTEALTAIETIPEDQLLDVGIEIFDPGIPEDEATWEKLRIFPTVRKAEARFIPLVLQDTLERTGQWGAVWVLPADSNAVDVHVAGEIIESDGEVLKLKVEAVDSSGRKWLDKTYESVASKYAYVEELELDSDPFQNLYNEIANDLVIARSSLNAEDLKNIRTISELRFATEFSPDAFDRHLKLNEKTGKYSINSLPARNEPMMVRLSKIREREYMFFDTLDEYYANFERSMDEPYMDWRAYSYDETIALREVRDSARRRMLLGALAVVGGLYVGSQSGSYTESVIANTAVIGGGTLAWSGFKRYGESKIHVDALRELGTSLEAEVRPVVVDIEGQTVELSGSVEAQYAEWRRLLRDIYVLETGIEVASDGATPSDGTEVK